MGVLPQPATTHGTSVVEDQLNSLAVSFASMSAEFVSMKEDRDDTILSLKLEAQELRNWAVLTVWTVCAVWGRVVAVLAVFAVCAVWAVWALCAV